MAAQDQFHREIEAYERTVDSLEAHYRGKLVVVKGGELQGAFDSFQAAATKAVRSFGPGPYLIRQVGAGPLQLPASVGFRCTGDVGATEVQAS